MRSFGSLIPVSSLSPLGAQPSSAESPFPTQAPQRRSRVSSAACSSSTASSTTTRLRRSGRRRGSIRDSRWRTGARRCATTSRSGTTRTSTRRAPCLTRLAPTRAARQAKAPTAREKGYLDAVERLFGDGDKTARDRAYADRMAELIAQFPDDDEAAAFHALALLATIPVGPAQSRCLAEGGRRLPRRFSKGTRSIPARRTTRFTPSTMGSMRRWGWRRRARTRGSRRRRATRGTCRRMSSCRSGCGTRRPRRTNRRLRRRWSASGASDCRWRRPTFTACRWLHYEYLQQGRFAKAREVMKDGRKRDAQRRRSRALRWLQRSEPLQQPRPGTTPKAKSDAASARRRSRASSASMRARRVVERGIWAEMKGQRLVRKHRRAVRARRGERAARRPRSRRSGARAPRNGGEDGARSRRARDRRDHATRARRLDAARAQRQAASASRLLRARRPSKRSDRSPIARPYPMKPAASCTARRCSRPAMR